MSKTTKKNQHAVAQRDTFQVGHGILGRKWSAAKVYRKSVRVAR